MLDWHAVECIRSMKQLMYFATKLNLLNRGRVKTFLISDRRPRERIALVDWAARRLDYKDHWFGTINLPKYKKDRLAMQKILPIDRRETLESTRGEYFCND